MITIKCIRLKSARSMKKVFMQWSKDSGQLWAFFIDSIWQHATEWRKRLKLNGSVEAASSSSRWVALNQVKTISFHFLSPFPRSHYSSHQVATLDQRNTWLQKKYGEHCDLAKGKLWAVAQGFKFWQAKTTERQTFSHIKKTLKMCQIG